MNRPPLEAASPQAWIDTHYAAWFPHAAGVAQGLGYRSATAAEVVEDDAALLCGLHDRLVDQGTPVKAAAKYLAGWFGGLLVRSLGYATVGSGASFVVDARALRWHIHPSGWPDGIDLGRQLTLVPPTHPWAGLPGTEIVASEAERFARANAAIAETVRPIVEALRTRSRLGLGSLWAEVGDGYAGALVHQTTMEVTQARVDVLRRLADAEGVPWRTRPAIWAVATPRGTVCCHQKGGCCLSHTEAAAPSDDSPLEQAFRRAFDEPDSPAYCDNCSLRDRDAVERRQLWRMERTASTA